MPAGVITIIMMMTIAVKRMLIELASQSIQFYFFKLGDEGRGVSAESRGPRKPKTAEQRLLYLSIN